MTEPEPLVFRMELPTPVIARLVVVACTSVVFPLNVFVLLQVLAVVVPNASENVRSAERSPPPRRGYVVDIVLALDAGVNPKIEDEAAVLSVPLLFDVYTIPFEVRFERVVMFCVVLTLN